MGWRSVSEALLGSQPGNEQLQRMALWLSVSASLVVVSGALYALWRWWAKPTKHREVAAALRDEGEFRASLEHRRRAMALYDLSIRLSPSAPHVHYLRGCLLEKLGQTNRAIAAWERCVRRHAQHTDAIQKLAKYGVSTPGLGLFHWTYAVGVGAAAVVVIALAGVFGH